MTVTVAELVAKIYATPRGPSVVACFNYDGVLISGCAATAFRNKRLREWDIGPTELAETIWSSARGLSTDQQYVALLDQSLPNWRGKSADELLQLGESLFKHEIASQLHHEVWRLVEAHHRMAHTVVLASSAPRFLVEPMARDMRAAYVLCTELEMVEGMITGRLAGAPLWGLTKARALRAFAAGENIDLTASFAYGNGAEDVMFLESVGNPVAVAPEHRLSGEAARRDWPVLHCEPRGGLPNPMEALRTIGFYSGFAAAVGVGIGVGLLHGSKRDMLDVSTALGSDLSLGLAGVDVRVISGAEHLTSALPCVFVFNHQSKIDPFVLMKLLRGKFTGVAKKDIKNVPGFGQLFQFAEVAFVDRGNAGQACNILEPALVKVRDEGISLVIAPEGTRSATPRLGSFKRGAFHIAMQAGVPMVPIVIRNAGEVMWRGAQVIKAGTVEVVVLPPVDTTGWQRRTIAQHTSQVRDMFVNTLTNRPGHPPDHRSEDDPQAPIG